MKFNFRGVLLFCAALMFSGCTSSAPSIIQPPEWSYEKDAIQLHFVGDSQLNLYQKKAHSLMVCLYHLRDPNGFNQLVDEKGGLVRLMECNRFDPSVTYAKRVIMQPDQELSQAMDRTDGAKYVGVVAGYYSLHKDTSVLSYEIPVTGVRKGSTLIQKTAPLKIELYLGPQNMIQVKDIPTVSLTTKGKEK